jgi:hypothetical protein
MRESVLVCDGTVKIELKVNEPGTRLLKHGGAVSFFLRERFCTGAPCFIAAEFVMPDSESVVIPVCLPFIIFPIKKIGSYNAPYHIPIFI